MALHIENYVRKPFAVKAVEVTSENIREVAAWCGGEVRTTDRPRNPGQQGVQEFIKIPVKRAMNERQTMAYYGDWVLLPANQEAGATFKIYTPKAFTGSFEKQVDRMFEVVERMDKRAKEEEKLEEDGDAAAPAVNFSSSIL